MLKGLMLLFLMFVFMIAIVILAVIYKLKSAVNKFRQDLDGDGHDKFDKKSYKEAEEYEEPESMKRRQQQYDFGRHTSRSNGQARQQSDGQSQNTQRPRNKQQGGHTSSSSDNVIISMPKEQSHKKMFAEDEGEYVSYEEVK